MATYKELKGFKVQSLPAAPVAQTGQSEAGAWSTGATLNQARDAFDCMGIGSQTATLAAGGRFSAADSALTESYNGTA